MFDNIPHSISANRDLFNCNPAQFSPYTVKNGPLPRRGLILAALEKLGYTIEDEPENGWVVRNADRLMIVSGEPNQLRTLRSWWLSIGVQLVAEHRRQHMDWKNLAGPGRPSKDDEDGFDDTPTRAQQREHAFTIATSLWEECRGVLAGHIVVSERWMDMALMRDLPRPEARYKVGERRAIAHALRNLFDTERRNPVIRDGLDGKEVTEAQIDHALLSEMRTLVCEGDAAGAAPRMALTSAIVLSPHPAGRVLDDLREVMKTFDLDSVDDVEALCKSTTT